MAFETSFSPGHDDRLTVLQVNGNNSKLLTASIDHRVAVYDLDKDISIPKQIEVFTAHDADIRAAKWFHPTTGSHFVTIGNDMQLKIWSEDASQAPMSGRRFKRVTTIRSEKSVPFTSVDVKTIGNNTYLAVVDRQGLVSLYEPLNSDEFHEWILIDQFYACSSIPSRSDHTSFSLEFDPNLFPLPYQKYLSDDHQQLTIAITALHEVKIYRSTFDADVIAAHTANGQNGVQRDHTASHRLMLFEVLRFQPSASQTQANTKALLRQVTFNPAGFRGVDNLAIASVDGSISVYEISVKSQSSLQTSNPSTFSAKQNQNLPSNTQQSSLTQALHPAVAKTMDQNNSARHHHPFPYLHTIQLVCMMQHAHIDAWSVKWDASGQMLLSSGADGTVKIWKRDTSANGTGQFLLFAEQSGEAEEEDYELESDYPDKEGEDEDERGDLNETGRN